ncbi:MAG: cupredoxin domain-containing protein [Actinomycetota bacterium]|nr:cupredoxin domain-containing protein [Actinomycetota bacterium]
MTYRRQRRIRSDEPLDVAAKPRPAPARHGSIAKPRRLLAVSAVAAGVLLAGCGSDDPTTEAIDRNERAKAVAVVGTDRLAFEPNKFTIPAGQKVTLELTAASVEHDFVVEGAAEYGAAEADHQADDPDDLHVAHADRGETATATFTIDKAGTYTVYCSVPGHRAAGMVASLEVIDAQG